MTCAFCGRENDAASRFCIDCGKPLNPSAVRVGPAYVPHPSGGQPQPVAVPVARPSSGLAAGQGVVPATRVSEVSCPRCAKSISAGLPFCGHCGGRISTITEGASCINCGASFTKGVDLFCGRCGHRVGQRVSVDAGGGSSSTQVLGAGRLGAAPKLSLLGESGEVIQNYT